MNNKVALHKRKKAMLWWIYLTWERKVEFTQTYYEDRSPQSLTGREIEIIFQTEKQK